MHAQLGWSWFKWCIERYRLHPLPTHLLLPTSASRGRVSTEVPTKYIYVSTWTSAMQCISSLRFCSLPHYAHLPTHSPTIVLVVLLDSSDHITSLLQEWNLSSNRLPNTLNEPTSQSVHCLFSLLPSRAVAVGTASHSTGKGRTKVLHFLHCM